MSGEDVMDSDANAMSDSLDSSNSAIENSQELADRLIVVKA